MTRLNKYLFPVLLLALATFGIARAANEYFRGSVYFSGANLILDANSKISPVSGSTGTLTNAHLSNRTRYKQIGLYDSVLTAAAGLMTSATSPALAIFNNVPVVQWAQGETTTIRKNFRVPEDYVSGQAFKCLVALGAASADTTLDFDVYVNRSGVAYDSATTNQSVVAVANDTTKFNDITLTVATDTFTAGDVVSLSLSRAAGTGGGATLNIADCYLSYTADM